MKKTICCLCAILALTFSFVACDKAESTSNGTITWLITAAKKTAKLELMDTSYYINNFVDMGLSDGDRALVSLAYDYDNVGGGALAANWRVDRVIEKIDVKKFDNPATINETGYDKPFSGFTTYFIGVDNKNRPITDSYWVWNKYHNVNVVYKSDGTEADFIMYPTKLSGDTICFNLKAKFKKGDVPMTKLLCYDLESMYDVVDADFKKRVQALDSIYSKITLLFYDEENDSILTMSPSRGKFERRF